MERSARLSSEADRPALGRLPEATTVESPVVSASLEVTAIAGNTGHTGWVEGPHQLPTRAEHHRHVSTISDRTRHVVNDGDISSPSVALIGAFLAANGHRPGPVVIKTSTADLRPRHHEPEDRLLESILSEVRSHFPDRPVLLTDGPAFSANYCAIAEHHGWTAMAARFRVDVCDLNAMTAGELIDQSVYAASIHRDAALTISVGKAKTHRRTGISGAEKALIGYLSGDKMGYPKLEQRHYLLPDIYKAIQSAASPMLHIIDGHNAIEGDGPLRGTPMETEFLLLGEDPIALDIELSRLYQFDPTLVISLFHSLESSLAPAVESRAPSVQTTLLSTEQSMLSMASTPARPPRTQPWLYRSLKRQHSLRNRWAFNKIRKAFIDVGAN